MILKIIPEDESTDNNAWNGVIRCPVMTTCAEPTKVVALT